MKSEFLSSSFGLADDKILAEGISGFKIGIGGSQKCQYGRFCHPNRGWWKPECRYGRSCHPNRDEWKPEMPIRQILSSKSRLAEARNADMADSVIQTATSGSQIAPKVNLVIQTTVSGRQNSCFVSFLIHLTPTDICHQNQKTARQLLQRGFAFLITLQSL